MKRLTESKELASRLLRNDLPPRRPADDAYLDMLLGLDYIPVWHNCFAALSTWLLLAGFVILPGTFTSLKRIKSANETELAVIEGIQNTPLTCLGMISCAVGVAGMSALWRKWKRNYIWLSNRVFLSGFLNSLAGLLSTLANVFAAHDGSFSGTAIAATTVATLTTLVCLALWVVYGVLKLGAVRSAYYRKLAGEPA